MGEAKVEARLKKVVIWKLDTAGSYEGNEETG